MRGRFNKSVRGPHRSGVAVLYFVQAFFFLVFLFLAGPFYLRSGAFQLPDQVVLAAFLALDVVWAVLHFFFPFLFLTAVWAGQGVMEVHIVVRIDLDVAR